MKRVLVAFGLLVLLFQTAYPALFTAWFYANRASIAKEYCINKQRPTLHCDGKCYLAQKILAAEAKQSGNEMPAITNLWVEWLPCLPVATIEMALPLSSMLKEEQHLYQARYAEACLDAPFRPPAA